MPQSHTTDQPTATLLEYILLTNTIMIMLNVNKWQVGDSVVVKSLLAVVPSLCVGGGGGALSSCFVTYILVSFYVLQ